MPANLFDASSTEPSLPAAISDAIFGANGGLDGALGSLTRCFGEEVGADTALFVVWDDEMQVARPRSVWGLSADAEKLTFRRGEGFVGRLLDSEQPAFELISADGAEKGIGRSAQGEPVTHVLGASVRCLRGPEGALYAGFSHAPDAPHTSLLWTAHSYAASLGLCLADSGVFSGLVRAAREDGLTGVLNYASLEEALQEEINRSERHGHGLSCCFLDLEDFKSVNDELGHDQGNQVLAAVALVLKRNVRSCDILGRYGGDEFVVVLPETGEDEARIFAERLREDIAYLTATLLGKPIRAQIGIAAWAPGSPSNALMRDADQAMRIAKSNGDGVVTTAPGASANGDSLPAARRRPLGRRISSRSDGAGSNGSRSNGARSDGMLAERSEQDQSELRKLRMVRRFLSGGSKSRANGRGSLGRRWRE